jgi:hypothetical protein
MLCSTVVTSLGCIILPRGIELDQDCCKSFADGSLPICAFGSTGHVALDDVNAVNWFVLPSPHFDGKIDTLILQSCPGADVEVLLLDLKSLESIRNCASKFKSHNQALHLLVRPPKSNLILIQCLVLKLSLYLNLSRQLNIPLNPMCICIDILFFFYDKRNNIFHCQKTQTQRGLKQRMGKLSWALMMKPDKLKHIVSALVCFRSQVLKNKGSFSICTICTSLPIGREHPQIDISKNLLSSLFLLCSTRSLQYSTWFISRWTMLGVVMALPGTQLEALEVVLRYCKSSPDFTCLWLIFGLHGWIIHFGL